MRYKKRPKNKQELTSQSGYRPKKELPKKTIVEFSFTTQEGEIFKAPNGRLKIMQDGGVSCLVKTDRGWSAIKAKLDFIKMKTVVIKKENPKK